VYLVDTNVFLEGLLEQDKVETVSTFFQKTDLGEMFISDLSLHSIGIILFKLQKHKLFDSFLEDLVIDGIGVISLKPHELKRLGTISQEFRLDFDDAYQYAVAEKYNYTLVSFDSDFDNTARGRKTPAEVLQG
jgi:predicted nucleic acid-binding protein